MTVRLIWSAILLLLVGGSLSWLSAQDAKVTSKKVAVTFDDLPLNGPRLSPGRVQRMTDQLTATFKQRRLPVLGLVNEGKLFESEQIDDQVEILRRWLQAGAELGNHTFSHNSLNTTPLEEFQEDVIRGETVTRLLLKKVGLQLRYFRHPFLRTGLSLEKKRAFEAFLQQRGYQIAPVTMENSDWMFNSLYVQAHDLGDRERMSKIGQAYLAYSARMFQFAERAAETITGRAIAHILLLHANELNADYLPQLLDLLQEMDYRWVTLEQALRDPVYDREDPYAGPAGVHWLFRWDEQREVDWKLEPTPPEWVQSEYRALSP